MTSKSQKRYRVQVMDSNNYYYTIHGDYSKAMASSIATNINMWNKPMTVARVVVVKYGALGDYEALID